MSLPLDYLKSLQVSKEENDRYYLTPNGKYLSVTSLLSRIPNKYLDEWRELVGEEKAVQIASGAANNGKLLHHYVEKHLRKEEYQRDVYYLDAWILFKKIVPTLDKNITKVYGCEVPFYSDKLKLAGTSDCICEWNGILSIVDFKTSKRFKSVDEIFTYFIQGTIYSIMLQEMTGLKAQNVIPIIVTDEMVEPLVYIKKRKEFYEDVIEIIKTYM